MHTKDLFVHNGGHRQAVEAVGESLPELNVVTALALVVESIDAVDARALVVSTKNEKVFGVLDLVSQQQADCLQRLLATIHVVAEEQIVGLWGESTVLKQAQQVIVLTVNITYTAR